MAQNYGRAQDARIPISNNITMRRECAQCRLFVLSHKAAVAVHVGAENGGELGLQNPPLMKAIILPRANFVKSHGGARLLQAGTLREGET